MSEGTAAEYERERCLAILDAHHDLMDSHLYVRLRNCMLNPAHDPREFDARDPLGGYHAPVAQNRKKPPTRRKK